MIGVMKATIILDRMIAEDKRDQRDDREQYEYLFDNEEHFNGVVPVLEVTRPNERHLSATTIEELIGAFEALQCEQHFYKTSSKLH